jgi:NAD(P)-dependent dehydrogenase (short-subunit alcohol dehydrogenase family)
MSRTAVVTGASAGIGRETARTLAAQGWRVIATGRDAARCAAAEAEIRAASAAGDVHFIRADLSSMKDTARLADEIGGLTQRIDVLFNNAGGMPARKAITAEGLEASFAGNFLSHFLLTQRLLPLLRTAAKDAPKGAVRIINTSSDGSEYLPALNLDDLATFETYANGLAYCSAKLANVLHARGLADRLAADGIIAHSFHPGTADSNFFDDLDEETTAYTATLTKIPLAESADTMLWLATSPEAGRSSGGYWYQRQPRTPNPLIDDAALIAQLWEVSERLVAGALS